MQAISSVRVLMLIEALSASSSISSIGASMVAEPSLALCSFSHAIRFLRVCGFFLITKTAGSLRFWSGTLTAVAVCLSKSRCVVVNVMGRRGVELAHPDELVALLGKEPRAVPADEPLVDPLLSLVAQIVVNAGDDDDNSVACVCRLADQPGVVGRLAGLNMPDNKPSPVPRPVLRGVLASCPRSCV